MPLIVTSSNDIGDELLRRIAAGIPPQDPAPQDPHASAPVPLAEEEEDDFDPDLYLTDFKDVVMRRLQGYLAEIKWQAEQALEELDDEGQFPKNLGYHELSEEQRDTIRHRFGEIKNNIPTDL